jgi:hypothetical protein
VLGIALLCGAAIGVLGGILALILAAVSIGAILTFANYQIGIWAVILLLPFSATRLIPRQMFGISGLNPLNVILAATILSLVLAWILRPKNVVFPRYPDLWWLYTLPFVFAAVHGAFYCSEIPAVYADPDSAITRGVQGYLQEVLVKPFILVVAAVVASFSIREGEETTRWQMVPVFLAAALFSATICYSVATGGFSLGALASSTSRTFLSWTGMHANDLGLLLNTAFALALFTWAQTSQRIVRTLLTVVIVLLSISVALTFSRGAYLGFLSAVVYFLFTRRKLSWFSFSLIIAATAIAFMPSEIIERAFFGVREANLARVSAGRIDGIWLPLLPTVFESPFVGGGLASIMWSEPIRRGAALTVVHAHSAYLQLLLDVGILGAVLVGSFWFRLWRHFRNLSHRLHDTTWRGYFEGASVAILIMLVQGVTDGHFTPAFTQSFIWVSAGVSFGLAKRSPSDKPREAMPGGGTQNKTA